MKTSQFHKVIGLTAIMLLMLTACGKSFKIKGNIGGMAEQNLRIVYATPVGVTERWATAKANRFELKGESDDPTLVTVYDSHGTFLAHFWLENGDVMKVRGTSPDPYSLEVKGPEVNERWYDFIHSHAGQYASTDPAALNKAIEDYVRANPADELSALLLLCDYRSTAGMAQVTPLLNTLKPEAKPESLLAACRHMMEATKAKPGRVTSLQLYDSNGAAASFVPTASRASILYLWTKQTASLVSDVQTLTEALKNAHDVQAADVLLSPDTVSWSNLRHQHFAAWSKHYWAPQGPMDASLKPLKISVAPTAIVMDSLGIVTYAGSDVRQAVQALNKLIH